MKLFKIITVLFLVLALSKTQTPDNEEFVYLNGCILKELMGYGGGKEVTCIEGNNCIRVEMDDGEDGIIQANRLTKFHIDELGTPEDFKGYLPVELSASAYLEDVEITNYPGLFTSGFPEAIAHIGRSEHIKKITINNNDIKGTIPEVLANINEDVVINMSDNLISGKIPFKKVGTGSSFANNCLTSCENLPIDGMNYGNNPFTRIKDCPGTGDNYDKCKDVLMPKLNEFFDESFESKTDVTITSQYGLMQDLKIKHSITFRYGISPLFVDVGNTLLPVEGDLKARFSSADVKHFREIIDSMPTDDGERVHTDRYVLYVSEKDNIFEEGPIEYDGASLREGEEIEVSIVYEDDKYYLELTFSSAKQVAFVLALLVAASIQLFM